MVDALRMDPLFSGKWTNEVSWEFYEADELPVMHLCTAVFCLPFQANKILLVEHFKRGWEIPGGHVEKNESSILITLKRELLEEAKISIVNPKYIGYRKIISIVPQKNEENGGDYPFPISYIPFYMAEISETYEFNNQNEIKHRGLFSKEEAIIAAQKGDNYKIVEYAYSRLEYQS